jgi:hypothetical protein
MFLFSSDGSGFESAGAVGELAFGDLSDQDGFERGKILNLPGVENGRLEIRSAESFKKGRNHEKQGSFAPRIPKIPSGSSLRPAPSRTVQATFVQTPIFSGRFSLF